MFGKPLVSVIVPCFNVEKDLEACLHSVLSQDYRPLDIIIVDNNSADGTMTIANKIAKDNPLMIKVFQEEKPGAPAARNHGLRLAAGEWVQFLDADDLIHPEKIKKQMALIGASTFHGTLVAGAYLKEYLNGRKSEFRPKGDPWLALCNSTLGITSSNLWRRNAVVQAGGWNEDQLSSQEYELIFRLLQKNAEVLFSDEVLTTIRERLGSVSKQDGENIILQRWFNLRTQIIDYLILEKSEQFEQWDYALSIALLKKLQYYYHLEPVAALDIFQHYIPNKFRIRGREMGRMYQLLFNTFGFTCGTSLFWKYWGIKSTTGK